MAIIVPLTQGFESVIDDDDAELVSSFRWKVLKSARNHIYAYGRSTETGCRILMHRLIMRPPDDMVIDHINGDGLDNRRENLRVCTQSQNLGNSRKTHGVSRHKGVYWNKEHEAFHAQIGDCSATKFLGHYASEDDAAIAYNLAAKEKWGEFALLNDVPSWDGVSHPTRLDRPRIVSGFKLSEDDVRAIHDMACRGESRKTIAEKYNIGKNMVGAIETGVAWTHLGLGMAPRRHARTSKLSVSDVLDIKKQLDELRGKRGVCRIIGSLYGVSHATIHDIMSGRTWCDVSLEEKQNTATE